MPLLGRLGATQSLPWRRPAREALLLTLVALAALAVNMAPNTQDITRICLSRALVSGHVYADRCLVTGQTSDRARHGGHLYTDKAPGMSVVEIVPSEVVRLRPPAPSTWHWEADGRLWFVHLVASGIPFLLLVFLVGRISEGLAPGYGGAALVVFGLGTEMGALGISGFDHVLTAALGFGAFVLATRRRSVAAGLLAGAAVATEYEALAILVLVLAYTALRGLPPAGRFVLGTLPGLALLGLYDWAAFGAPWHPSYRYLDNEMRDNQLHGVLGVHLPTAHGTELTFVGNRGLFVLCPVLVAAAAGLWLVWRAGYRPEALLCTGVTLGFLLAECGYFDPYGGRAPGPRFFCVALPFLALGLGPAFARWTKLTTALAAVSILASTAMALTWERIEHYRQTVWGELSRVLSERGSSRFMSNLAGFALDANINHIVVAALVFLIGAAAFVIALIPARRA